MQRRLSALIIVGLMCLSCHCMGQQRQQESVVQNAVRPVFLNAKVTLLDTEHAKAPYVRDYPMIFEMRSGQGIPFFVMMGSQIPVSGENGVQSFYRGIKITMEAKAVSDSRVYFSMKIEHGIANENQLASHGYFQSTDVRVENIDADFDAVVGLQKNLAIDEMGKSRYMLTVKFERAKMDTIN